MNTTIIKTRNRTHKYNKEIVSIEALKYNSRKIFALNSAWAYSYAARNGILDSVCSHMEQINETWTFEKIEKAALNYTTRNDFRTNSKAYDRALRLGILDLVCSHMEKGSGVSDNDVIYIWNAKNTNIYKIGITSNKLGIERIQHVSKLSGFDYKIIIFKKIKEKANVIENELLKLGCKIGLEKFNGSTEFRELNDQELKIALSIVSKY